MRKLASIRKIDELNPIEGADAIECAVVGGWKVVAQKGLYNVGDLAVYFEIDSWIPTILAPFLSKGKEPREFEGIKGERLKTIKLRGQLSQGLLMPMREIVEFIGNPLRVFNEGEDLSESLGVVKWEKPVNAQLAGICKGNFPSLIPKTDQERVQNLKKEVAAAEGVLFEVTEKLEGSSMTCYLIDGEFGVCSRNMDLKETAENSFWKTARRDGVEEKMRFSDNFAIQGELVGPGIQGNSYNMHEPTFFVFDIWDIEAQQYYSTEQRLSLCKSLGLQHTPVFNNYLTTGKTTVSELLTFAEGKSALNPKTEREGLVFKNINNPQMSFKAISNKWLLKND